MRPRSRKGVRRWPRPARPQSCMVRSALSPLGAERWSAPPIRVTPATRLLCPAPAMRITGAGSAAGRWRRRASGGRGSVCRRPPRLGGSPYTSKSSAAPPASAGASGSAGSSLSATGETGGFALRAAGPGGGGPPESGRSPRRRGEGDPVGARGSRGVRSPSSHSLEYTPGGTGVTVEADTPRGKFHS